MKHFDAELFDISSTTLRSPYPGLIQQSTEIKCEILLVNRLVHHYNAPIKVDQMEGSGLAAFLVLAER